ncbi:MAG: TonB-dependent receptor [Verrucomicrobiae bacterium]|nr:TonB-dependent receptor [Verrucomicrobiae bacterium]NNJ43386.1 TonB-dependent receptor [Akkermansiaceae bacterium]
MNIENTVKLAVAVLILSDLSVANTDDGELSPLTVVGGKDRALDLVGSAAYLDTEDIRNHSNTNINRILAKVPGVYVREENGYGNFPNISIRGVDGGRSAKLTIMEDGVLMAPAAYSAPSAYYSPSAGRMSGLEVLKGSSQIKYGPHTTGGVINYLSTEIPEEQAFYAKVTYGSDNTLFGHSYYGDTVQTSHGLVGYLLEMHYHRSDGFRSVQGRDALDTGFERIEPMVKMFWEPDSAMKQRFELKFGSSDFDAKESYLGLTEADASSGSHDLYSAAQFDNMDAFHYRTYLKYTVEPTDDLKIEATAYYNRYNRNWYKLNKIDGGSLDTALLDPAKVMALRGMTFGSVANVKANSRDYYSYGLQLAGQYDFDAGAVHHSVVSGVRYHTDRVRRFQWSDDYVSDGAGDFSFSTPHGVPGDDGNRRQQTDALALFIEDAIKIGKTTIRPGVRYEHLDVEYDEWAKSTDPVPFAKTSGSGSYGIWAGGVGFTHALCDTDTIYGGVYRGVSVPGPRSHLKSNVEEETTLSYELGWRHNRDGFSIDLAGFYTDFSDLIARESIGGGTGEDRNAGDVEVLGIELLASYDAAYDCPSFSLPMYVSATWTQSEFKTAIASGGEDGIWDGAVAGNELPYVPEWKLAAGVGLATDQWGVNLDASFTSSQYGTGNNFSAPVTSSRQGKLDSFVLVDLSGYYQINDNWTVIAGINNLFDEVYISSRVPHGPRNARGRHLYTGFEVKF